MSSIAFTGITGKSGKAFFYEILEHEEEISKRWNEIRIIVRENSNVEFIKNYSNTGKIKITYIIGDLDNIEKIKELCTGCDTLVHIAGIHWSMNVVKVIVDTEIKRAILVHTTGIYSKYKKAGEEYRNIDDEVYRITKENNIALSILRPTMIYGNVNDKNISVFIKMIDKLRIMPTVKGAHYLLQPVHYKDLGKAYYQVLMNPKICNGKDYILSGKEPIELRKIFEIIAKELKVKRNYISCPFWLAYSGAWIIYVLSFKKIDYREKVQRLCEPRFYSHEQATNDFGYNPISFEEGIKDEIEEYQKLKNFNIKKG